MPRAFGSILPFLHAFIQLTLEPTMDSPAYRLFTALPIFTNSASDLGLPCTEAWRESLARRGPEIDQPIPQLDIRDRHPLLRQAGTSLHMLLSCSQLLTW